MNPNVFSFFNISFASVDLVSILLISWAWQTRDKLKKKTKIKAHSKILCHSESFTEPRRRFYKSLELYWRGWNYSLSWCLDDGCGGMDWWWIDDGLMDRYPGPRSCMHHCTEDEAGEKVQREVVQQVAEVGQRGLLGELRKREELQINTQNI